MMQLKDIAVKDRTEKIVKMMMH